MPMRLAGQSARAPISRILLVRRVPQCGHPLSLDDPAHFDSALALRLLLYYSHATRAGWGTCLCLR